MPITYHIDVAGRLVISRATGRLTDADLRQYQQQLWEEPAFTPTFCELTDWTNVTALALTTEGVRHRVRQSVFQPGTPQAMVVSGMAMYGFARMIQIMQSFQGGNVRIFWEITAALAWLRSVSDLRHTPRRRGQGVRL